MEWWNGIITQIVVVAPCQRWMANGNIRHITYRTRQVSAKNAQCMMHEHTSLTSILLLQFSLHLCDGSIRWWFKLVNIYGFARFLYQPMAWCFTAFLPYNHDWHNGSWIFWLLLARMPNLADNEDLFRSWAQHA